MNLIQKTNDYDQFKVLTGNRTLNRSHLNKLTTSIILNNLLEYNPILVNDRMEIIDGQHRLEVARKNKLEIYYLTVPGVTLSETIQLNDAERGWILTDYINSYVSQGNEEYLRLKEFKEQYDFGYIVAGVLLAGKSFIIGHTQGQPVIRDIKIGNFKVKDYDQAVKLAEIIVSFDPFADYKDLVRTRSFIEALEVAMKTISYKKLLKKLSSYGKPLTKRTSRRDYLREFEDVLNYRARLEVRL